jgi:hypothetical protein
MNPDPILTAALVKLRVAHARYDQAALAIPDTVDAPFRTTALPERQATRLSDALREMRDHAGLFFTKIQRRLFALDPESYPDPDRDPPQDQITWTSLPIHESEPRD